MLATSIPCLLVSISHLVGAAVLPRQDDGTPLEKAKLHFEANDSMCLAISLDGIQSDTGTLRVADCSLVGPGGEWQMATGPTELRAKIGDKEFCVRAGDSLAASEVITVDLCSNETPKHDWWYAGEPDRHISLMNEGKCLDLQNGVTDSGGRLQLYDCYEGNKYQMWRAEILA